MTNNYTISEGLQLFTEEFDFCGKINTKQVYLRAVSLFTIFIESNSTYKNSDYPALNLSSPLLSLHKHIIYDFSTWLFNQQLPVKNPRKKSKNVLSTNNTISQISTKKYSPTTVNLYIIAFGRVLDFWLNRELISFNTLKYKKIKYDDSINKSIRDVNKKVQNVPADLGIILMRISQEWLSNLPCDAPRIELLKRLRARALISVITNSGLRVSDIVTLTKDWRNHDIDASGSVVIVTARSGTKAYCYFHESTLKYIDEYIKARDDMSPWLFIQHGKYGTNTATDPGDFSKVNHNSIGLRIRYGAPLSNKTVWSIVRSIGELAGYNMNDNVTPNALRHWLVKHMCDNDVPLNQLQEALGLVNLDITIAMYIPHSSQEKARKCINEIHATLRKQ